MDVHWQAELSMVHPRLDAFVPLDLTQASPNRKPQHIEKRVEVPVDVVVRKEVEVPYEVIKYVDHPVPQVPRPTSLHPYKNRLMTFWISLPPKTKAQQQHPEACCRKSQTILMQLRQSSFRRNPIPPPANIPILSEH